MKNLKHIIINLLIPAVVYIIILIYFPINITKAADNLLSLTDVNSEVNNLKELILYVTLEIPNAYRELTSLPLGPENIINHYHLMRSGFTQAESTFILHYFLMQNISYGGDLFQLQTLTTPYPQSPIINYDQFLRLINNDKMIEVNDLFAINGDLTHDINQQIKAKLTHLRFYVEL